MIPKPGRICSVCGTDMDYSSVDVIGDVNLDGGIVSTSVMVGLSCFQCGNEISIIMPRYDLLLSQDTREKMRTVAKQIKSAIDAQIHGVLK